MSSIPENKYYSTEELEVITDIIATEIQELEEAYQQRLKRERIQAEEEELKRKKREKSRRGYSIPTDHVVVNFKQFWLYYIILLPIVVVGLFFLVQWIFSYINNPNAENILSWLVIIFVVIPSFFIPYGLVYGFAKMIKIIKRLRMMPDSSRKNRRNARKKVKEIEKQKKLMEQQEKEKEKEKEKLPTPTELKYSEYRERYNEIVELQETLFASLNLGDNIDIDSYIGLRGMEHLKAKGLEEQFISEFVKEFYNRRSTRTDSPIFTFFLLCNENVISEMNHLFHFYNQYSELLESMGRQQDSDVNTFRLSSFIRNVRNGYEDWGRVISERQNISVSKPEEINFDWFSILSSNSIKTRLEKCKLLSEIIILNSYLKSKEEIDTFLSKLFEFQFGAKKDTIEEDFSDLLIQIQGIFEVEQENTPESLEYLKAFFGFTSLEVETDLDLLLKEHIARIIRAVLSGNYILESLDIDKLIEDDSYIKLFTILTTFKQLINYLNESSRLVFFSENYLDVPAAIDKFTNIVDKIIEAKKEKEIQAKLGQQRALLRNQIDKIPLAKTDIRSIKSPKGFTKETTLTSVSALSGEIVEIRTRKGTYYALMKHFQDETIIDDAQEQELLTDKELEVKLLSISSMLEEVEQNKDSLPEDDYFELKNNYLSEEIKIKHTQERRRGETKQINCVHCNKPTSFIRRVCKHCEKDIPMCLICYNSLGKGMEVSSCSQCGSLFHYEHLRDWQKSSSKCPYCRSELPHTLSKSILESWTVE